MKRLEGLLALAEREGIRSVGLGDVPELFMYPRLSDLV
jgi:hypothetical protein